MIRVKHMLNLVSILFLIVKYTNVITKVKLYQVKIGCMVLLLRQNREKRSLKILFHDMSSELAIDDSEAILYVRVLSDDIVKVDGDRHAYLLDKNFNIIYCHYNIGKFPWGAILNGNYYYINDINEIVK